MSSLDSQQLELTKSSIASKKMRMTMACVRCRSKKVKCDFAHPSCTRCAQAKATCSYEGSSTQVDIFNIVKLNDIVSSLQERVHSLESTMSNIHNDTQTASNSIYEEEQEKEEEGDTNSKIIYPKKKTTNNNNNNISTTATTSQNIKKHSATNNHQWTLSLTPTGLRIDTNIVSLPNLYDILLSGVSQLDLDADVPDSSNSVTSSPSLATSTSPLISDLTSSEKQIQQQQLPHHHHQRKVSLTNKTVINRKTPLWRSRLSNFPLYNTWSTDGSKTNSPSTAEEMNRPRFPITTDPSVRQQMMDIYEECFLCLPDIGCCGDTVYNRFRSDRLDPFLTNAIFAWSARHGAIYHGLFPGYDPAHVGEYYFHVAKELLKDRFMVPTIDTLHGLLVLYIYSIGNPSGMGIENNSNDGQQQLQKKLESEAYIYLGLAIRMCLDLKLHNERNEVQNDQKVDRGDDNNINNDCDSNKKCNNDKKCNINNNNCNGNKKKEINQDIFITNEKYRRFFWALYFLETLCALHSDRPFSLPPEDQISVVFPERLECEIGEQRWRTEYIIKRFSITRIYRNIIQRTAQDKLLLSSISELDASLDEWFQQLPSYLQYRQGDFLHRNWRSTSFREQACVKLNFEYHFQRCQLYAIFLTQQNDRNNDNDNNDNQEDEDEEMDEKYSTDKSMELMAKDICVTSAKMIAEILYCWKQLQQRWCHFSIESLMMALHIFKILLNDKDYSNLAKEHLMTMLSILEESPIRHHHYAIYLMAYIKKSLYPNGVYPNPSHHQQQLYTVSNNNNNNNNNTIINDIHQLQRQTTNNIYHHNHVVFENENNNNNINISTNQPSLSYKSIDNQHSYPTSVSTPMDYYTYRMQKLNGMIGSSLNDLPFSDFLYNPVIDIPSPFGPYGIETAITTATSSASSTITTDINHSMLSNSYPLASSSSSISTSIPTSSFIHSSTASTSSSSNIIIPNHNNPPYPTLSNSTLTSLNATTYHQQNNDVMR